MNTDYYHRRKETIEIYQVIEGPVRIPAGTVCRLSDVLATPRAHQLRRLELGWFITLTEVSFETGDVLGFCRPLDPGLMAAFTPPELKKPVVCHPSLRPKPKKAKT